MEQFVNLFYLWNQLQKPGQLKRESKLAFVIYFITLFRSAIPSTTPDFEFKQRADGSLTPYPVCPKCGTRRFT